VPGYVFQSFVTSLPPSTPLLEVWREYSGPADCENMIRELQPGFALTSLCLESFWAIEVELSMAALTYQFTVLFQRDLGWQTKVTIRSLRFLVVPFPVLARPPRSQGRHQTREDANGGRAFGEKFSLFPNCNPFENRPAFPREFLPAPHFSGLVKNLKKQGPPITPKRRALYFSGPARGPDIHVTPETLPEQGSVCKNK
jgi:hypothetical protein